MTVQQSRFTQGAVFAVGMAALLGIVILAVLERPIPEVLPTVAVAALTGLVGLLIPTKNG